MATKMFVNLAVKDLQKTMEFFGKLGFTYNYQFTDEKAACMIINNDGYAMLLTEPFFKNFTKKDIVDAHKNTEVLLSISVEIRNDVDQMLDTALSMGATEAREPQDHGFMYGRSFNDLDGHIWEVIWMDESHLKPQ